MYYYNETVEGYDQNSGTVMDKDVSRKNKWILPVGIGLGVLILIGIVVVMRKKKPVQKFGFKFY